MHTQEKLQQAFATALSIPPELVVDDLTYNGIPEWDSTAHMVLVAEIEAMFDVLLDTDDIIDISSVAQSKKILGKYGVHFE